VLDAAKDVLARCDCETACYKCLLHFRNQSFHALLNRHQALDALGQCSGGFQYEHEIPPSYVEGESEPQKADSSKEERFLAILAGRGFPPPPAAQFSVTLGGGSHTVADFA
jgi:hypothetical protein